MVNQNDDMEVGIENQEEAPINGDVLEKIFSHVPLLDLVPASNVSKAWKRATYSSLRHLNALKPWLILHAQSTRSYNATSTRAYDPRSETWIEIESRPSIRHAAVLRSSQSNLLYTLSPSRLSFSFDRLHLAWHHADPPGVWRTDPIVAIVGHCIVVAGGVCDFEDDPLAVEVYDLECRRWSSCESMPTVLKNSSSSQWLSVASDDKKLVVMEKHSGLMHTLDPASKTWSGRYDLRPDPHIVYSVIAFSTSNLILVGLIGDMDNVKELKMWRVNRKTMGIEEKIGEMPIKLLEKLKGENSPLVSIGVCFAGNFLFLYNSSAAEEMFLCELVESGCRWRSIPNATEIGRNIMERTVFSCSEVGIDDLQRALRSENRRFTPLR